MTCVVVEMVAEKNSKAYTESIAKGLDEITRSILFITMPQAVEKAIGEHAASALILRVFSESAYNGFKKYMEMMNIAKLTVSEALKVFTESFPAPHPFHVFKTMEEYKGGYKLVCGEGKCGGCRLASLATVMGAIEGVLKAIGVEARAVFSSVGRRMLCRSTRSNNLLVIYPVRSKEECYVVVEKLNCNI
jgi:hypothetical protein